MSSSRLARLRNQAGAGNANNTKVSTNQRQSNAPKTSGSVNPMQILEWHETRLRDLLNRFKFLDEKMDSLAEMQTEPQVVENSSHNDANQLLVVNDILEKINSLSNRIENMEVLTKNLKDDYLSFKNGSTENKVELVVTDKGDRVTEIRQAENTVNETKAEVKEIQEALQKLKIEPSAQNMKPVKLTASLIQTSEVIEKEVVA